MPKVTAWKCPHTGTLFEDKREYSNHLSRLSRERVAARKWKAVRDSVKDIIIGAQAVNNAQELVDYIIQNQREFMIRGVLNEYDDNEIMHEALEKGWDIEFPKLASLEISSTWRTEVSNSHNCPRDGYTNWGGNNPADKSLRSYPGWHGSISSSYNENDRHIKIKKPDGTWKNIPAPGISDMVRSDAIGKSDCGICTGSGGGGSFSTQYGVSLFQSDFPNMAKQVTFAIVRGDSKEPTWGNGRRYDELNELGCGEFKLEELENGH